MSVRGKFWLGYFTLLFLAAWGVYALAKPALIRRTTIAASLAPMTVAYDTSGEAPFPVHFSAIDRNSTVRASSNITGITVGQVRNLTTAGTGTIRFVNSGDTISYQAPGDTQGTPIALSADLEVLRLYSANAVDFVYLSVDYSALPGSDQTDTITITTIRDTGVVQPTATVATGDPDYSKMTYHWWVQNNTGTTLTDLTSVQDSTNLAISWGAPVFSYMFKAAGTYVVKLSVWNESGTRTDYSETITVSADSNTKYYVDSARSDDSGDGLTPATADKTWDAGMANIAANRTILFKRGGAYSSSTSKSVGASNVRIGTYYNSDGTDDTAQAKPTLAFSGTGAVFILSGINNTKVSGLNITGPGGTSTAGVLSLDGGNYGTDVLIYDVEATAISRLSGQTGGDNSFGWLRFHAWCNYSHQLNGSSGNHMFCECRQGAIVGNHCQDNSGSVEHIVRVQCHDEAYIANNYLATPAATKHALTVRGKIFGQTNGFSSEIYNRTNAYAAVLRNHLIGVSGTWAFQFTPQDALLDERHEHGIIDGNYIEGIATVSAAVCTGYNSVVRNNIINNTTGTTWSLTRHGVEPTPDYHKFFNNSCINEVSGAGTEYRMVGVVGVNGTTVSDPTNIILKNNIAVEDGADQFKMWQHLYGTDLSSFTSDYNLRDGAGNYSDTFPDGSSNTARDLATTKSALSKDTNSIEGVADFTNSAADDFTLQGTSAAIGQGDDTILPWVRFDRAGLQRTTDLDAGAHERGASAPTAP